MQLLLLILLLNLQKVYFNIYSFLLQDIVFLIDLTNYMLYNLFCSGNRMKSAFRADFFVSACVVHVDLQIYMDCLCEGLKYENY